MNCASKLAEALSMQSAFAGFYRYSFPSRSHKTNSSHKLAGKGIFGNSILSKWPITDAEAVPLPEIVEQYPKGCLKAVVSHPLGDVLCYNVHLEACSGIAGRVRQFETVLRHLRNHREPSTFATVIAGDFNTLSHGLVRCSPVHSRDKYRCLRGFSRESEWWQEHVFSEGMEGEDFTDPFDKFHDVTLIHPASRGKLDWLLFQGLSCVHKVSGHHPSLWLPLALCSSPAVN